MIIFENEMLTINEDLSNNKLLIEGKKNMYSEELCDEYKTFMNDLINKYHDLYLKDNSFNIVLNLNFSELNFTEAYLTAKNLKQFHYDRQELSDKFIKQTVIFCKSRLIKYILTGIIKFRKMPRPVVFTSSQEIFDLS